MNLSELIGLLLGSFGAMLFLGYLVRFMIKKLFPNIVNVKLVVLSAGIPFVLSLILYPSAFLFYFISAVLTGSIFYEKDVKNTSIQNKN